MARKVKTRTISHYTRGVRASYRSRIGRVFRDSLARRGIGRLGNGAFPCNQETRLALADSIFRVEDELESRLGGQPDHPAVVEMRLARQRVYADLGWDDDGPEIVWHRGACSACGQETGGRGSAFFVMDTDDGRTLCCVCAREDGS